MMMLLRGKWGRGEGGREIDTGYQSETALKTWGRWREREREREREGELGGGVCVCLCVYVCAREREREREGGGGGGGGKLGENLSLSLGSEEDGAWK